MNTLSLNNFHPIPEISFVTPRIAILSLVLAGHLAVLSLWSYQSDSSTPVTSEMAVSFTTATQPAPPDVARPVKVMTPAKPVPAQTVMPAQVESAPQEIAQPVSRVIPAPPAMPAPILIPDTEPDYKASYLQNPAPLYPMAARRMGMQGKVMLSVEVLASGACGQINIQKSSGYPVLDNAALKTVKTWRFTPASVAGHKVDKWFVIPIQFSLKDNA